MNDCYFCGKLRTSSNVTSVVASNHLDIHDNKLDQLFRFAQNRERLAPEDISREFRH